MHRSRIADRNVLLGAARTALYAGGGELVFTKHGRMLPEWSRGSIALYFALSGAAPISVNLIFHKKLPNFFQLHRSPWSSGPQGERDGTAMRKQMLQRKGWRE